MPSTTAWRSKIPSETSTRWPQENVSAASAWELPIKAAIGKIALSDDLDDAIDRFGLRDLPVTRRHTHASDLTALPHKDPFDAVLVAQATVERLAVLTPDTKLLETLPDALDARR